MRFLPNSIFVLGFIEEMEKLKVCHRTMSGRSGGGKFGQKCVFVRALCRAGCHNGWKICVHARELRWKVYAVFVGKHQQGSNTSTSSSLVKWIEIWNSSLSNNWLYRLMSQFLSCFKPPFVGTLNFGQKTPESIQQTRNWFNHPELRNNQNLILFGIFVTSGGSDL